MQIYIFFFISVSVFSFYVIFCFQIYSENYYSVTDIFFLGSIPYYPQMVFYLVKKVKYRKSCKEKTIEIGKFILMIPVYLASGNQLFLLPILT